MKWDLPKGDQFLPDTSIDELKALHRAEKDTKARDRLLVYMARKRGDAIRKIADDFGSTYSTIRDWLVRAKGGLDRLHDAKRSGPRADWTPHSWQESGRISWPDRASSGLRRICGPARS